MEKLDVNTLKREFERAASILPNYDDDPITVAIFPGDNNHTSVNDRQNGVVGTSLFGNMFIQVNPLIKGYEDWIKYVFAHEYHHTVWGNYWFMIHNGELENKYKAVAENTDVDYAAYMFGNEKTGIPWCAGYAVGYIVEYEMNANLFAKVPMKNASFM